MRDKWSGGLGSWEFGQNVRSSETCPRAESEPWCWLCALCRADDTGLVQIRQILVRPSGNMKAQSARLSVKFVAVSLSRPLLIFQVRLPRFFWVGLALVHCMKSFSCLASGNFVEFFLHFCCSSSVFRRCSTTVVFDELPYLPFVYCVRRFPYFPAP